MPRIHEQIVDDARFIPQERVLKCFFEQIVHVPAAHILKESHEAVTAVPQERVQHSIVEHVLDFQFSSCVVQVSLRSAFFELFFDPWKEFKCFAERTDVWERGRCGLPQDRRVGYRIVFVSRQ